MKVLGWNKYSGEYEGKAYEGYYLYLSAPRPQNVEGVGDRAIVEKIRKSSPAFSMVPMLNPGDEIKGVYYDKRGNVTEVVI